ncbi:MAG: hypothetical protein AB1631_33755 [Acidobacteriota bacterium]
MARQPLFSDTDEKTERVLIELLQDVPAWKKLEQVEELTDTSRQLTLSGLRKRYPQASNEELRLKLAALLFGRETVIRAYGRDPESEKP